MALSYLIGRRNVSTTPWNEERDAVLVRLWGEGYSASQIADQIMGVTVSRCAVLGRVHRLKLPARKPRQPAQRRESRPRRFVPKPPPPAPRPVTLPESATPKMRRLSLIKLKPQHCRWPLGDGPFLFCGLNVEKEPYCPYHQRLARVREPRR